MFLFITTYANMKQGSQWNIFSHSVICDGILQCDFRQPKNIQGMFFYKIDTILDGSVDILIKIPVLLTNNP